MRYIGNKTKLLLFIESTVRQECGNIDEMTFCDLFAGTGVVGKHFKNLCKEVISNDLEYYSYVLLRNYISNNQEINYKSLIEELNNTKPVEGIFYKHFSPGGSYGRMFFTKENASKIDGVRQKIEEWKNNNTITDAVYYFLLASLLESADKYANTTGVYGAYLKKFNKRAAETFILLPYEFEIGAKGTVYQEDANVLVKKISGDILYLDPPYNSRQYGSNYHILNYIAKYKDIEFRVNREGKESKTGLSEYNKSLYSQKSNAKNALDSLISNSKDFKYVFMSYNDEGILSLEDVKEIFEKYGTYKVQTQKHKRYKSNKATENNKVIEYIHILIR